MVEIMYLGSEQDIATAAAVIKKHAKEQTERKARLEIQRLIDKYDLKASILINGNAVWSKKRVLHNLRRILKEGTLYNPDQKKPPILSQYFYQFLTQVCGSSTHYDIYGWIHMYPTIEHLREFFKKNEFGKPVSEWIPKCKTDARAIVEEIEVILFPFSTYLKTRNKQ